MISKPTITGPAAAMFDETPQQVSDELFDPVATSQDQMRMQIIETRLNEFYDCLIASDRRFANLLPINRIHRDVRNVAGIYTQDMSRIAGMKKP